jgi:hypothetical protein
VGVSFSVCYDMCAHKRKGNTMLCCSDCEDARMHVMCAVCQHDSAERECEQRQEDDEQASTISLGSYKAEGNMDNAHVELSAARPWWQ